MHPITRPRPSGILLCTGFHGDDGRRYGEEDARRYGWLTGRVDRRAAGNFRVRAGDVFMGRNVFTDAGRQNLSYLLGFRSPAQDYAVSGFSVGTGTEPGAPGDEALQNAVAFADTTTVKAIDAVTFPDPFCVNVAFSLGLADCNGYLLTEWGLISGNGTLLARRTTVGLNKVSDFSPSLEWVVQN